MRLNDADIIALFGGSGSGKSFLARNITKHDKRLLVFDVMGEYGDHAKAVHSMGAMVKGMQKKSFRLAFQPRFATLQYDFAAFCRIAYVETNLRMLVEELNTVTEANRAPPDWRNITSRGRHKGLHIIGISQRPAGVDKDFIANATKGAAGRLRYEADQRALMPVLGRDALKLGQIPPRKFLAWEG